MAQPRSALGRILAREEPDWWEVFAPCDRELAQAFPVADQPLLYIWSCFGSCMSRLTKLAPAYRQRLARATEATELELPSHAPQQACSVLFERLAALALSHYQHGTFASETVPKLMEAAQRLLAKPGLLNAGYEPTLPDRLLSLLAVAGALRQAEQPELLPVLMRAAVLRFQQLLWLGECRSRGGVVLQPGRAEPFPAAAEECVRLLLRLAESQPLVRSTPVLARVLPRDSKRFLPLGPEVLRRMLQTVPEPDHELTTQLAQEIRERRHFLVDHLALIELDQPALRRLALAPEQVNPTGASLTFLVEHALGSITGTLTLSHPASGGSSVSLVSPVLATRLLKGGGELAAGLALPLLAAWRDLVVADVREQQYERQVRHRASAGQGRRRGRALRRGEVDLIHYLPRRLAARRAQLEDAARRGTRRPPRLYHVGVFVRRLPDGNRRSREAAQLAATLGLPLRQGETCVEEHWRGGSPEERAAAGSDETVRRWRSWSALDLLRLRTREQQPVPPQLSGRPDTTQP